MRNLEDLNRVLFESIAAVKNANSDSLAAELEKNKAVIDASRTIIVNSQLQLNIAKAIHNQEVAPQFLPTALLPDGVEYQGNCRVLKQIKK
jgi:hypothetical protein